MKIFKTLPLLLVMVFLPACAGLSVPDMLAKLDDLTTQCHGLVGRLEAKGVQVTKREECDKAAAQARAKLTELLDQLRAELVKAGI